MSRASSFKLLVAAVVATLACGTTAFADDAGSRKALGIEPTFLSVPLPSGSLTLDLSDTAVISVMGLTRAEAEQVVAARSVTGRAGTPCELPWRRRPPPPVPPLVLTTEPLI
jgi:hypothetical protein